MELINLATLARHDAQSPLPTNLLRLRAEISRRREGEGRCREDRGGQGEGEGEGGEGRACLSVGFGSRRRRVDSCGNVKRPLLTACLSATPSEQNNSWQRARLPRRVELAVATLFPPPPPLHDQQTRLLFLHRLPQHQEARHVRPRRVPRHVLPRPAPLVESPAPDAWVCSRSGLRPLFVRSLPLSSSFFLRAGWGEECGRERADAQAQSGGEDCSGEGEGSDQY